MSVLQNAPAVYFEVERSLPLPHACLCLKVPAKVTPLPALCLPFADTHDAVLRFNTAPTEGYERDVGNKTTIRIINSQVSTSPGRSAMNNNQSLILSAGSAACADTRVRCTEGKHGGIMSNSINYFRQALMFY